MKWKWKNGMASLETPASSPGDLFVSGTKIQRLRPDEGTRVLGVRMAMDGSFGDELRFRTEQSKSMARKLYSSKLSALDSYMVYETRYRPALQYPLRVTTFTTAELQQIQKPFIHLLLPKLGLNRHTPRAVIYGPTFRGGLGIINLEEEQVSQHFQVLQGHIRRKDDIGKSLRIQLTTQQTEIGCGEFFLNTDPTVYNYSNQRTRLSYLWTQCQKYNITVSINNVWTPNGGPDNRNRTIMDFAVTDAILRKDKAKLQSINACRLYLKVMWPHDLLRDEGHAILDEGIIRGLRQNTTSSLKYPYQAKPSNRSFSLWKEFIYRTFCLIRRDDDDRLIFKLATPVIPGTLTYDNHNDYAAILSSIQNAHTLEQKFESLPCVFRDIIGDINLPLDEGKGLVEAIVNNHKNILLASDGSYLQQSNIGSHAYKLVNIKNAKDTISGAAMSPQSDKMSSSPTEHYGAMAILTTLIVLLEHHGLTDTRLPTLTVLIDNKEVVTRGNILNPPFMNVKEYLTHDFDLWEVMSELQDHLKLTVHFEWIKSHQTSTGEELSADAIRLNTEVDALATDVYKLKKKPPHRGFYFSGTVCFHQNGYHIQDIYKAISSHESDKALIDYYLSKGWTIAALEKVDWPGMQKFLKYLSPIVRCNAIQMLHNWQNTGYQKGLFFDASQEGSCPAHNEKIKDRLTTCPFGCGHTETPFHFMTCTSSQLYEARCTGLNTLRRALKKIRTAPSLIEAIYDGIFCYTDQTEYELSTDSDPLLFDLSHSVLLSNQLEIGWENFLKGFITKDWRYIQQSYYSYLKVNTRKYNAEKWVSCLLRILHKFRTDLWHVRNSAIHGGSSKLQGQTLRHRLIREVHSLYDKDRKRLSLLDKQLFHMPKSYRLKQGNHQLLLWTKRAQMTFDIYEEPIEGPQQTYITDWLTTWNPTPGDDIDNTDTIPPDRGDSCYEQSRQSSLDDDSISTGSSFIDSNDLSSSQIMQKKNPVIGGTRQYLTPLTSSCQ
jgi:hypothetical protein